MPELKTDDAGCILTADEMLAGNIHVLGSIHDTLAFSDADEIDWNAQVSDSPNTFQLYLQCLNPVAFLTRAYQLTENRDYLTLAEEILASWLVYAASGEADSNTYTWYDHGVSLRAENMIYFILTAESLDAGFSQELRGSLLEHGRWLYDDDHYFYQHNHGIYEDAALIYLSCFLKTAESGEWLAHAKERLQDQLSYAFSDEMVHVENSPGYATGVIDLFQDCADFLTLQGDEAGSALQENLASAAEYVAWATKPDGFLAMYGDTFGGSLDGGRNTAVPELSVGSAFYPKSGYYYYRDGLDGQAVWCGFRAGYSSKTHKHADDCSFQLYALGQDIFVDSGMYNYMTGSAFRDYMVSSSAHNTVVVDGNSYSVTAENSGKTGILKTEQADGYDYVLAFLDMYDGVSIDRHFYNFGGTIVLYDDILSEEEHTYEQLFHLYPGIVVASRSDDEVLLQLADREHYVRIRQLGDGTSLCVKEGYYSETMNNVLENQVLSFSTQSKNAAYITVITIENADGTLSNGADAAASYDGDARCITIGNHRAVLQPRERISVNSVEMRIEGDSLYLENSNQVEGASYAWYLIDCASGKAVEKSDYSYDADHMFTLTDPDVEYWIKAYARSPEGQRKSAIVKAVQYSGGKWRDVTEKYPYLELKYLGQSYTCLGENTYRFEAECQYSWKLSIAWYIYRNGGGYDYVQTDGSPLEYVFTEEGTYDVMYYIRTLNGDCLFYNFEELKIA